MGLSIKREFTVLLSISFAGLLAASSISAQSLVSPGQPLAVAHISNTATGVPLTLNSVNIQLGYLVDIFSFDLASPLFEQYNLTVSDVGKTFTATAANDPDFSSFVQHLTDGTNDFLAVADSMGGASAKRESQFFSQRPAGGNGIDLRGFQVGSIGLQVDSLTINSPGSNPNGDGNWTDVLFEGTVTFYAVPEPTVFALAVLGVLAGCLGKYSRVRAGLAARAALPCGREGDVFVAQASQPAVSRVSKPAAVR